MVLLIAFVTGCGSNNASDQTTISTYNNGSSGSSIGGTARTTEESPSQFLSRISSATRNGIYTVEISSDVNPSDPKRGFFTGQEVRSFKYTQKTNNIRIEITKMFEGTWDSGRPQDARISIYNDSKKQSATVGIVTKSGNPLTVDMNATAGWKIFTGISGSRKSDMIMITIEDFLRENKVQQQQIQKQGDSLIFDASQTYVSGDTKLILECKGPNGMPSRLYKKVDDYGANKGGTYPILHFAYENVGSVPDSLFELPNDAHNSVEDSTGNTFSEVYYNLWDDNHFLKYGS